MATILHSKPAHEALSARTTTAIRVVLGLSLAAACILVFAQDRDVAAAASAAPPFERAELDLDQLERAFWACDHAASTTGVDGPAGMACGSATEQLKLQKFNGDFEAMLAWWRENKESAHQTLDRSAASADTADDYPMP